MNVDLVMSSLQELSDPDFQLRAWSGNEPGVVASFVECVEALLDDSGLSDALSSSVVFSEEVDRNLRELEAELMMIDESQSIHALLRDPGLARAREMAKTILGLLAA